MKHAGSLESTQEARLALGYASSNSYASSKLLIPACFISYLHERTLTHEPIVKYIIVRVERCPMFREIYLCGGLELSLNSQRKVAAISLFLFPLTTARDF